VKKRKKGGRVDQRKPKSGVFREKDFGAAERAEKGGRKGKTDPGLFPKGKKAWRKFHLTRPGRGLISSGKKRLFS